MEDTELHDAYRHIVQSFRAYLEAKLGVSSREPSVPVSRAANQSSSGLPDAFLHQPHGESSPQTASQRSVEAVSQLHALEQKVKQCRDCPLCRTRTHVVFGAGAAASSLMLVGEAPGRDEDLQGIPFVGAAGRLLNETFQRTGIEREDVYIANILKCRPPGNRDPKPNEIMSCLPHLKKQIALVQPHVICTLGSFATQVLLKTSERISRLRGKVFPYDDHTRLVPTYHPAACIRKSGWRQILVSDLMLVQKVLRGDTTTVEQRRR